MASTLLLESVVRQLRAAGRVGNAEEMSDGRLLECFIQQHDETAFAAILRRHGPLVLSVCRNVLHHSQDVEDAFQAAFLVLVRRASSIRKHEALASWLHGVALRTARRALIEAGRRRLRERNSAVERIQVGADELSWREVQTVLHEEIDRLPEGYRAPLVLCYLEGQTNARAARQLNMPVGSLSKILGRARGLLRGQLLRRGVSLPAGLLLALPLSHGNAAVASALAFATSRGVGQALAGSAGTGTASVLANSVARGLITGKVNNLFVWLLALGAALAGGGWLSVGRGDAEPTRAEAKERREPALQPEAPPAEEEARADQPNLAVVKRRLLLRHGGSEKTETETAVAAGLVWLAAQQKADGHWALDGGAVIDTAGTAFGLLPFLGAGHAHKGPLGTGPYAANVQKGLDFLIAKQAANGDLGGGMYGHALATIALAQAYTLTADPKLKAPLEEAVDFIVKAQHSAGGWRYAPGQIGDTSVTAWQVAALHAARQGGLVVPAKTLELTNTYLDHCQTAEGGYGYTEPNATPTMTAAGLLCRLRLGWGPNAPSFRRGVVELGKFTTKGYYHVFWATPVFFRVGGAEWEKWNARLRDDILPAQEQDKEKTQPRLKGSWPATLEPFGQTGGRLMVTSLALLTLEVYYRDELPLALAPPRLLTKDSLLQAWSDLAATDEVSSRRSLWALAKAPEQSIPLLREQLPPRPPSTVDRRLVARRIADLDSDSFEKREQASAELEKMGKPVEVLLRAAHAKSKSAEARRRLGDLLAKFENSRIVPESIRLERAIEVLEQADTMESRRFLRELAEKEPTSEIGRAAKAALARLHAPPGK